MGRKSEGLSEGKKNIITGLIQEYDIKTAEDIQDAQRSSWRDAKRDASIRDDESFRVCRI